MKNLIFLSIFLFFACNNEPEEVFQKGQQISFRTLPTFIVPYQHSSGDIKTKTSSNLINWSSGYVASTTSSILGTTSTIYNFMIPDTERKCIVLFQNSSNEVKFVEYQDGNVAWTSPASVSTAVSHLLPSVDLIDGVAVHAHVSYGDFDNYVKGSIKNGSSWNTPDYLNRITLSSPWYTKIISDYSPTLEYHNTAAVQYLITGTYDPEFSGYGLPQVYWKDTTTNYFQTSAPGITLGATSGEFIASLTPVALEKDGDDKLYMFYTNAGVSNTTDNRIRYFVGNVTGNSSGAITSWDGPYSVSGDAYTVNKIDGLFVESDRRLVIIFRNCNTDETDVAYSDDFGSSWTIETDIAAATGAPSIVNLE